MTTAPKQRQGSDGARGDGSPHGSHPADLQRWVADARARTIEFCEGLTAQQLWGPQLATVNPLLWEVGHVAWFQEKWVLRHALGERPTRDDADQLYDSFQVPHDRRWALPLPDWDATRRYALAVRDRVLERLDRPELAETIGYFVQLSAVHEEMHSEAFTYGRQTLGYPAPHWLGSGRAGERPAGEPTSGRAAGDVELHGGRFLLGAPDEGRFVFDNEKWAHAVDVSPFAMAATAVTQGQFAEFVESGGYERREYWSDEGWRWRCREGATLPLYWRRAAAGDWQRRVFDRWMPLAPHAAMVHVNWHEAQAWCRWAGRRLPSEAEWELAATRSPEGSAAVKRRYPWGDEPPDASRANLDWVHGGPIAADRLPAGDSDCGCRQLLGNVWEWTSSVFGPYPGFEPDCYREYSQPWFGGTHRVLRGGSWSTPARLIRATFRNFYPPHRRDVFAGLRSCPL